MDFLAAAAATLGIYLSTIAGTITSGRVFALTQSPEGQHMTDQAFIRWAIEQGGLVVAILVILYFYRRDFRDSQNEKKEVTTRLFQVVETNTRAMEQLRNSIDDAQNERFPPRRQLGS